MKVRKNQTTTTPKSGKKAPVKASAGVSAASPRKDLPISSPAPARQADSGDLTPSTPPVSPLQNHIEHLRTGELASRIEAAARLAGMGDPQAAEALRQALRDPTAEVAREAALALGRGCQAGALEALAAVVENADTYFHPSVRTAAAESLGQMKDPRSVVALTQAVRDPLAEPSRAAIRALGLVAHEDAVPLLLSIIENRDNFFHPSVRVTAAEVLATIPTPDAKECLLNLVANQAEAPEVRQAAALTFA